MDNLLYRRRVTEFFGEYITNKDELICYNGTMPLVIIHDIVKQLFDNCVFINIRDMQKTALRECSVFLSYDLFETYLEGVNKEWITPAKLAVGTTILRARAVTTKVRTARILPTAHFPVRFGRRKANDP